MKKQTALLLIVLSVVVTVFVIEAVGQEETYEGQEAYIPSKIEWFTLDMNAMLRSDIGPDTLYTITFMHDFKNTIYVFAQYDPELYNMLTQSKQQA